MNNRRIDISQTGKLWILIATLTVGLYILWQLSNSLAGGSLKLAVLLGAGFAAIFILAKIARDWRRGVYYFLAWLLFEDLVRKYMGNNMYIYFAKDILLVLIYGSFLVSRMNEKIDPFHPPFRFALGAFFILGLAEVFNPSSPSIYYGLLGIKLDFFYIPLMFVGYAMFRDEIDIPRFFSFNMIMGGLIAAVGIIQTFVGLDFLNPHNEGTQIEELSHAVRATHEGVRFIRAPSIFVSEGRFGGYMFVASIVGMGGAGYLLLRSKRKGRFAVFTGLGLVVLGAIMTGSRGALIYLSLTAATLSAGMLWGAPPNTGAGYRLVKAIRRGLISVALALWLSVIFLPGTMIPRLTFYEETLMPSSRQFEAGDRVWDYPVGELKKAFAEGDWLIGHGIGTGSLGTDYVSKIMGAPPSNIWVENGFGDLIVELGILGPILWIAWSSSLLVSGAKTALRVKGTWAFPIALSIVWYIFAVCFPLTWGGFQFYQNFVSNAFLWLMVGILFRLPSLVRRSQCDLGESAVLTP